MVKFLNFVPWGGLFFCYTPNQVIDLDEDTAIAREELGLGKVVRDKSKPKPEPVELKIETAEPAKPAPQPQPEIKAAPQPQPDIKAAPAPAAPKPEPQKV